MRYLPIIVAVLALTGTAQAAPSTNLCVKDGWSLAQSASGATFSSQKECQKARQVFTPSLSVTPSVLQVDEDFTATATGLHPFSRVELTVPGWFTIGGISTNAAGEITIRHPGFPECRTERNLTFTITDSFGVHASARIALC